MCNSTATVHRESRGKKKLFYFRCYEGPNGGCGTIQCRNGDGQLFVKSNMTPLSLPEQDEAAHLAAEVAKDSATKEARKVRRETAKETTEKTTNQEKQRSGIFNMLFADSEDE